MKALLVRVGIDLSKKSGGWNAPVNPDTGKFAYVPIIEDESKGKKKIRYGYETSYDQFKVACQNLDVELPEKLYDKCAHLDPDFSNLTYGDERDRGEPLWKLENGDILAFYAGLFPTKPCEQKLIYAMIGLYVVDKVIPAEEIPEEDWHRNAHTRRNPDKTDIVVFAKPGLSGRLERCIPIGECRGKFDDIRGEIDKNSTKAYRVTRKLLDEWGELSVQDGWIQRSGALPSFSYPERFYEWFKKQNIRLVARNN